MSVETVLKLSEKFGTQKHPNSKRKATLKKKKKKKKEKSNTNIKRNINSKKM